ncbi:adenosine receptor A2b-like [Macrobrachium nipponense]|uniref:adenosine receptor A2b-like n=1 Tax=Macrobrachium nipponense TaxID=159736 RepID=UPI0030C8A8B4
MVSQYSINPTEEWMLSGGSRDPTVLGPDEENRALGIATRFGYGLLVPAILIFESVVTILINGRNPELKKRCSRIFVNNLAISGSFIGLVSFVVTFFVIDSFRDIAVSCNLEILPFYWTLTYFHMVSVTSLLCLSFDRYLAICWPLRYHEFLTNARCRNMAAACWILSLACLLVPTLSRYINLVAFQNKVLTSSSDFSIIMRSPVATDCQARANRTTREMELWLTCRRTFTISFGVSYFFSLFLILCMYGLVMREFCLLKSRMHATTSMKEEDQRARIKSTRDLILVATLYLTLSLPHVILKVSTIEWTPVDYLKNTHQVTIFLAVIHQILFLPLYAWRFPEFRKELCSKRFWKSCAWPCGEAFGEQCPSVDSPSWSLKASASTSTATSQALCV